MPFLYKCTFIFEGLGHGYSETLYCQRSTNVVQDAYDAVFAAIYNKRSQLLGKQYNIKALRVALVEDDAGAKVTRRFSTDKAFLSGNQAQEGIDSNVSLQVLLKTPDSRYNKFIFLSGAWRSVNPFGDTYDPAASAAGTWGSKFGQWVAALQTFPFGWLHQIISQTANITGYTFNPATGLTDMVLAAPGIVWPDASTVRVSVEFPAKRHPLDGTYLVTPTDATHCTTSLPRPTSPFTLAGKLRVLGHQFASLAPLQGGGPAGTVRGQNFMTRKRGRPILVSRGRQPVQVRW